MEKDLAIAVDFGATNLRGALISKKGKILRKIQEKTLKKGKSGKIITYQILNLIKKILKKGILGIGISSIGPLDLKKGEIINAPNLPFKKIPVLSLVKKCFSLPSILLNDCTAAVWGEKHFGAGKKFKNLVYITISTGIGGGAIVDDHLLIGYKGNAVEVGHMIIESEFDVKCGCKRKNHWEAYASGKNIPKFFKKWQKVKKIKEKIKVKKSKEIFKMAKEGNKIARKFLRDLGKINAKAVSNIAVMLAPEIITFGGSVVLNNEKLILEPIKSQIEDYAFVPKIKKTPLGQDVTLLGAAAAIFWPPFSLK